MTIPDRLSGSADVVLDDILLAANVLLGVAARSVLEVEATVTTPQLRVLVFLASCGPRNLGAVAEELGVHSSNAGRTCEKLVKADLITREEDPADRRYVLLTLSRAGRGLVDGVLAKRRAALAEVVARVEPELLPELARGFAEFARAAGSAPASDGRFALLLSSAAPSPSIDG
jgi:DNA-binding MarR family transcriptional regulator